MDFRRRTVLIADDNKIFTMYLSIVLNRMGFDVIPAESGSSAINLSKRYRPDMMLLSMRMPDMDWHQTIKSVKANYRTASTHIIMISDKADPHLSEECLSVGCSGVLRKPVDLAELNVVLFNSIGLSEYRSRRSMRVSFGKRVAVTHNGVTRNFYAVTLSERGIYIRKRHPLPIGDRVEIALPLKDDKLLYLKGTVVAKKGLYGSLFKVDPGIAIEFNELTRDDATLLRSYVVEMLAGDILEEQEEAFIAVHQEALEESGSHKSFGS
jgi:CheY-like chemotaxis protein